jgi:hypothetical protein
MLARTPDGETIDLPDDPSYLSLFKSLGLVLIDDSALGITSDEAEQRIRGWKMCTLEKTARMIMSMLSPAPPTTIEELRAITDAMTPAITMTDDEAREVLFVSGLYPIELA